MSLGRALLLTAVLCVASVGTVPTSEAGELQRRVVYSANLAREMAYLVYLPDGYEADNQLYPVLYLLHGAGDSDSTWADKGLIREKADQLIENGSIPPTLIVMPGCTQCWWIDSSATKSESAFWDDLVPEIEKRFRVIKNRQGRLLAGLSAGGYGVVRFAMRYPDRIAAAAAFSPAIYAEAPPITSNARLHPAFKDERGQFSQGLWLQNNYPSLIDGYFAQTYRVPLFLAAGDNDRLGAAFETALLFKRMMERQPIKVELRIVDGGHNWAVWASVIDEAMRYMFHFASRPTARPATTSTD